MEDYVSKHTQEESDALLKQVFDSTLQEKTIEITESGTTEITADADFLALKKVNLNVNVQGGGGSVEYFDINREDKLMYLEMLGLVGYMVKYPTKIQSVALCFAFGETLNDSIAISIDTSEMMDWQGTRYTIANWLAIMGVDLSIFPRLTKEEFYAI